MRGLLGNRILFDRSKSTGREKFVAEFLRILHIS